MERKTVLSCHIMDVATSNSRGRGQVLFGTFFCIVGTT